MRYTTPEAEEIKAAGAKKAAELLESNKVAVLLAQIEKTGDVLRDANATYFFGADSSQLGGLLGHQRGALGAGGAKIVEDAALCRSVACRR